MYSNFSRIMLDPKLRKKAKKKVSDRHGFLVTATILSSVSIILYVLSLNFSGPAAYWIKFPILVLALALGVVYVSLFGFSLDNFHHQNWREEAIDREAERLYLQELDDPFFNPEHPETAQSANTDAERLGQQWVEEH